MAAEPDAPDPRVAGEAGPVGGDHGLSGRRHDPVTEPPADLARFFELSSELLVIATFDGQLLRVSPSWTETLGWTEQELTCGPYLDLVHPDDRAATIDAAAALVRGETLRAFENRYRHKDGGYRWLRWTNTSATEDQRIYSVVTDITEERRRQSITAELEHVSGVGTWDLEVATGTVTWSTVTHAIHGTAPGDFDPTVDDALGFYLPAARVRLHTALGRLLDTGEPYDLEACIIRRDGRQRWVRTTGRAATHDDQPHHAYGSIQDITDAYEEREHLQHFHDLVELSEEGIVEARADGVITFVNPRMAGMLGTTADAVVGNHLSAHLIDDPARSSEQWRAALAAATDDVVRAEVQLRGQDGGHRWALAAVRTHRDTDGRPERIIAVISDISAQKQREADLARAQSLLEEAQSIARLGHWRSEPDLAALSWSPFIIELFGQDPDTFQPTVEAFYDAIHPEDRERVQTAEQHLRDEGSAEVIFRIIRPDGTQRTVREMATSTTRADGSVQHVTGTIQDITELQQAQQALIDSEDRLQRVLQATNDGWWDNDLRTGEVFRSDRWWEIHGRRREDHRETMDVWRRWTHPEDLAAMDAQLQEVFDRQAPTFRIAGRTRHRDGHLVPVVVRGFVEYDDDGQPIRMSGATTDVTDAKRAQAMKDEFVSTVSHELRTPLTSIGGSLEMLATGRAGRLPERADQLLEVARRNTDRLRLLIDDLLNMEQLVAGRITFTCRDHDLAALIDQAIADNLPYARAHGVGLVFTGRIDGVRVRVDAPRLQQVFANYLSNAAKYSPADRPVEMRMRIVGDRIRTDVIDRGPGVPADFADRLFERFAQADPADERSRGGTGLGLAISREIVSRLDGTVGYDSEPGVTSFWVDLPIVGD